MRRPPGVEDAADNRFDPGRRHAPRPIPWILSSHSCGGCMATWGSTKARYKKNGWSLMFINESNCFVENQIRCIIFSTVVRGADLSLRVCGHGPGIGILVDANFFLIAIEEQRIIAVGIPLTVVTIKSIEALFDRRASCVGWTQSPFSERPRFVSCLFQRFGDRDNVISKRPLAGKDSTVA